MGTDEFCYSPALDGLSPGGAEQTPDFYMDFQGDRPDVNDGTLPVSLFKVFDHFIFRCSAKGLGNGVPYYLQITYKLPPYERTERHTVKVNGFTFYKGRQFGGEENTDYCREFLPPTFTAVIDKIPAQYIKDGKAEIEISEPESGFRLAELRLTKTAYKSRKGEPI